MSGVATWHEALMRKRFETLRARLALVGLELRQLPAGPWVIRGPAGCRLITDMCDAETYTAEIERKQRART